MQNLLQLILRFSSVWTFLILEALSFYIVIQYNQRQGKIFFSSASRISGNLYERYDRMTDYFSLKKQVESLKDENSQLRAQLDNYNTAEYLTALPLDSVMDNAKFIPAGIISKSVLNRNNTITINRGRNHGIEPHMGVINSSGIIGIVRNVTDRYAVIMSIFHSKTQISAAVKGREDVYGSLVWESMDTRYMNLKYIPKYKEEIQPGDTIVTTAYSNIFPQQIELGTIEKIERGQDDPHFQIKVKMKEQLSKLDYVYVVKFLDRAERDFLNQPLDD